MLKKLFLQYYIKKASRYFQENRWARLFTAATILLIFFLIGLGVFFFTYRGFEFTQTEDFLAEVAPLFLYQVFILVVGFLIFVSAVITSIFTFFNRHASSAWIVTTPAYQSLAWVDFIKVVFNASWPFIVIALPMFIAANVVFDFSVLGFVLAFMSLVLFAVSSAALGVVVVFISAFITNGISSRVNHFGMLVGISVILVVLLGIVIRSSLVNIDFIQLFQIDNMELAAATADRIVEQFRYFPSHYPAFTIYSAQLNDTTNLVTHFLWSLGIFVLMIVAFMVAKTSFLSFWQTFAEGGFEARKKEGVYQKRALLYRLTRSIIHLESVSSPSQVLFTKELLVNVRTAKNFMWAGFLAILMFIFLSLIPILGNLGSRSGDLDEVGLAVVAMQFSVISFFIGAFVLRFVFPSFSQEGSASWVLGSAPINLNEIFFQKMKFYILVNVFIATVAALFFYFNLDSLGIDILTREFMIFLFSIVILTVCVTVIGLALGVKFVNFKIEDPQLMGTSLPGLFIVGTFLSFGLLGGFLFYQHLDSGVLVNIIMFNITLVLFAGATIILALKALKHLEYSV